MKKVIAAAALAVGLAGPALADPVLGVWKTQVDDGAYAHVTFSQCGAALCGVISKAFDSSGEISTPNVGKQLVWDMSPNGGGKYSGGKIWQPSTGKVYKSKMTLSGSSLKVAGCVGPICKKQTWTRVK
ncbi:Uncharacterized conserved protein, DUF2147 family [Aliiroseovarius halocynthiae]|uniref:DUF2147 domain-containing protein n=1 Tax=Aliiroseovarius halocynthiae TaxID=985055 RepID=A0A545SR16_9RHOB|nr:DUF2147 domain-containing protein [Aliiroseovarius halocynthiae]TQV67413.1 DUF2147 domain-containing protein [Aliiroseovarius halocynthiae]SMR81394.1 Uncharacterized conserved protein, DUF2147 family [Aliiroseovarius halocynthiae]